MILLFFLSGKFPLFQSNDDVEALMEIAAIIGRKQLERTTTLHGMFPTITLHCFSPPLNIVLQADCSFRTCPQF